MSEKEDVMNRLYTYAEILREAPRLKIVLMEKPDSPKFMEKQIFEVRFYLPYINKGDIVLDLGSGGGFPGIPLAVMREDARFILVDRKKRHIDFLKTVVEKLEIRNVFLLQTEAENLSRNLKDIKVDVVCARAVSRIKNILSWAEPVLKCGGKVVLGKGNDIEKEIDDAKNLPFSLVDIKSTSFGNIVVYVKVC